LNSSAFLPARNEPRLLKLSPGVSEIPMALELPEFVEIAEDSQKAELNMQCIANTHSRRKM
jgi:hypothetical protein